MLPASAVLLATPSNECRKGTGGTLDVSAIALLFWLERWLEALCCQPEPPSCHLMSAGRPPGEMQTSAPLRTSVGRSTASRQALWRGQRRRMMLRLRRWRRRVRR